MKIMCVLGTRPEIIKMAPIIRASNAREGVECVVVHTGQHYSPEMDRNIFFDLGLDLPNYNLSVGSDTHAQQTGKIMIEVESVIAKETPAVVLVQGDTNTVLGAGLTAAKMHVPVGHVEAGLRSFDRTMPEEINRIVVDHISHFLFSPTEDSRQALIREGIAEDAIVVTGNTIVDAVNENIQIAERSSSIVGTLPSKDYLYVTVHRSENVDSRESLERIVRAIVSLSETCTVVWPIHPRTTKQLKKYDLLDFVTNTRGIVRLHPVGFLDSLMLQKHAKLVLTDSGGLQEESCILGTPCITLRDNTERPETLSVGANRLVGTDINKILATAHAVLSNREPSRWKNPFGDGTAAVRIIDFLQRQL